MPTGTYSIADLWAARFANAAEFGLNSIAETMARDVQAHNEIVQSLASDLCEFTTDRRRIYGTSSGNVMTEVDEHGRAATQRTTTGAECGFPLRLYQFPIGWSRKYLETATVGDLVTGVRDAQRAHFTRIRRSIQEAVYNNANFAFTDHLRDNIPLTVRRFINADAQPIPDGPNGEVYDPATHQHYTSAVALLVADVLAAIDNVVEHGHGGTLKLAINRADEAAFRALVGFNPYVDPRLVFGALAAGQPTQRLDISRLDNRAIGILGAAEVWVKSWAPQGYCFAYDASDGRKPLAYRQRTQSGLQGLRLAAEIDTHPLLAQYWEAEFGLGVWTRTNGAVHYFASPFGAWATPVFAG